MSSLLPDVAASPYRRTLAVTQLALLLSATAATVTALVLITFAALVHAMR